MPPITAVFTAKEHMLLRIIIYLFQFHLCAIQVILAYHHLWNRLRWQHTITDLTTIRRIHDSHCCPNNPLSMQHNDDHGLYLPNQPHIQYPSLQQSWLPCLPPPGNHGFPPLPVTCPVHCHHIPTAEHHCCQRMRKRYDCQISQRRTRTSQDPPHPHWDVREELCQARRVLPWLAHLQHQLGRTQLGTHASMGQTAATTSTREQQLILLLATVITTPHTIPAPMRVIMTTTRPQTLWTYTVKKFIIISTNICHGIQILKRS